MNIKNKKGDEVVLETIIFIVLNLVFFSMMIFFVVRAGSSDVAIEEANAKKIALIIDAMEPKMEVNVSLEQVYNQASKNKFTNVPVYVNGNTINVKVKDGVGSGFDFFTTLKPQLFFDDENKLLTIRT